MSGDSSLLNPAPFAVWDYRYSSRVKRGLGPTDPDRWGRGPTHPRPGTAGSDQWSL